MGGTPTTQAGARAPTYKHQLAVKLYKPNFHAIRVADQGAAHAVALGGGDDQAGLYSY